jgi:hypothetical protein
MINMKKHFLSVIMALFAITSVTAQNFTAGIQGGVDAARFSLFGATGGPLKYKTDLAGGIFAEAGLGSNFGVQLEVNYSAQGTGLLRDDATIVASYELNYITVPVLVKFYGSPRLNFFAGPQVGFLLNAKGKQSGAEEQDVKEQFKGTAFYAVFGTEYKFANGLFVNGRYNLGIGNLVNEDNLADTEIKQRYFSFRLGYAFKL